MNMSRRIRKRGPWYLALLMRVGFFLSFYFFSPCLFAEEARSGEPVQTQ